MISRRKVVQGVVAVAGGCVLSPAVMSSYALSDAGDKLGDMVVGSPDAPLTIIEYFSLACQHCQSFHLNVYPGIKRDFVDTGKARFIARDFPHNRAAFHAAILARCAGPDRYFAFVDTLFMTFDDWTRSSNYLGMLIHIGELGGVSRVQFETCLEERAIETAVLQSIQDGKKKYNVNATPTLIVNGRKYEDSMRLSDISRFLERLLSAS